MVGKDRGRDRRGEARGAIHLGEGSSSVVFLAASIPPSRFRCSVSQQVAFVLICYKTQTRTANGDYDGCFDLNDGQNYVREAE